jgi:MoaA/NifB/PqqE/SkfB family radical SAM enzyme
LIDAGLDRLWVSLDGARPESYADVRLGATLSRVLDNVARLQHMRPGGHFPRPEIGIAFVAMTRNVADLPEILNLARRLRAKRVAVSNVLPTDGCATKCCTRAPSATLPIRGRHGCRT